jgi:hypothetical protein
MDEIHALRQFYMMVFISDGFRPSQPIPTCVQAIFNPTMHSGIDEVMALWFEVASLTRECQELDTSDADYGHRWQTVFDKIGRANRLLLDSRPSDDCQCDPHISPTAFMDDSFHMPTHHQHIIIDFSKFYLDLFRRARAFSGMNIQPIWDLAMNRESLSSFKTRKLTDQSHEAKMDGILEA